MPIPPISLRTLPSRPCPNAGGKFSLLTLGGAPRLGRRLCGAPPGLVLAVPSDRLREAGREVRVPGLPAELRPELRGVDRVAAVVAGSVAHPVEVALVAAERLEDLAKDGDVAPLAIGTDQVGLADAATGQDGPDCRAVVLGVDPVAHAQAVAVELRAHPIDQIRDLARDELLHVLVGPVVVRAVGDRGPDPEGAVPRAHEQVGAGLGGAVGARGTVRRLLGEARRVVEDEVAVDLVGRDVVVADVILARRLEERVGALDVGAQEGLGVRDGVVVVALRRVVDDGVVAGDELVQERAVADVAHHELDAVLRQARDVLRVAGVGELVEHGHAHAGLLAHHVMDEVRPDEAAAAGDDDVDGLEVFLRHLATVLSTHQPCLDRPSWSHKSVSSCPLSHISPSTHEKQHRSPCAHRLPAHTLRA